MSFRGTNVRFLRPSSATHCGTFHPSGREMERPLKLRLRTHVRSAFNVEPNVSVRFSWQREAVLTVATLFHLGSKKRPRLHLYPLTAHRGGCHCRPQDWLVLS